MPFSLDIEGYRSRIRPEAILQRCLSPLRTDLGRFIPGEFLADSKGVPSQISRDVSENAIFFRFWRLQITESGLGYSPPIMMFIDPIL
ncbi:unnamed protein product [Linum trigynum]|uniref:Uncharacterized protein n=1 Tax=Linum trigynum TaxID=586398 RepID=A0AAV2EJM3_9ROSI